MQQLFTKQLVTIVAIASLALFSFSLEVQADEPDAFQAVVLGKKITAPNSEHLNQRIFSALLKQYGDENNVTVTTEELDAFVDRIDGLGRQHLIQFRADRKKLLAALKEPTLSDEQRLQKQSELNTLERNIAAADEAQAETPEQKEQSREMKRKLVAPRFVWKWKVNKSLYEKYGGRVIFQQGGPEPIDAYRDFLREQEKKGAFQITDKQAETAFWRYFTDGAMHTFLSEEEGKKAMETPWWMLDISAEKR